MQVVLCSREYFFIYDSFEVTFSTSDQSRRITSNWGKSADWCVATGIYTCVIANKCPQDIAQLFTQKLLDEL